MSALPAPRLRRLLTSIALGMALMGATPASASCPDEDLLPTPTNLDRVRVAVVCLHNEERQAAGVAPLRTNPLLISAANAHVTDMVGRRFFEHDTPEGVNPFERMKRAGYLRENVAWSAGENIGWGTGRLSTPRSLMDAWMRSYGHRITLLASDFSELGVGIALGAPTSEHAQRSDAATYAVDFGWRRMPSRRALKSCLHRVERAGVPRSRRAARSRCRAPTAALATAPSSAKGPMPTP